MNYFLPLKVMVFGAKYGSYCITPAFQETGLAEIVGICSPSKENREIAAKYNNIDKTFPSFKDAFEQVKFDIAAIAVPPKHQEKIALECISKGIHIFAEKPLGTNLKSAKNIVIKAKKAGIKTAVDFLYPECLIWKKAKELLLNNEIGHLHHVIVNWSIESHDNANKIKSWKNDADLGGGVFSHFGSHLLHYLEWFCGPIKKLNTNLFQYPNYFNSGDSMASISAVFNSGVSCSASLCSAAPFGLGHRIDFFGADGSISLINDNNSYLDFSMIVQKKNSYDKKTIYPSMEKQSNKDFDQRIMPISRLAKRFIKSILNNSNIAPSFEDALKVQILLNNNCKK